MSTQPNSGYLDPSLSFKPSIYDIDIVCFAHGTLILTDRGAVPVQALREGDLVATRDHGMQPIRWIGSQRLSADTLIANERLLPIRIRQGALGAEVPSQDLLVSPQHRILVRSHIARRMFGTDEVLVAAKLLCALDGIEIAAGVGEVEYFHLLFDRHEVIIANDAEAESLYTGPEALKSVGPAGREEILTIFPELMDGTFTPARPLVAGRKGRHLTARHLQNSRSVQAAI
ncbi:Hint domain-containing protein [Paracoccus pacificus]|uniref:Hint domain-containing protein n=1 Tax=Paracoccus pacificus TaxID=1463598 RepID=A0ABW4R4S5_9RHOB